MTLTLYKAIQEHLRFNPKWKLISISLSPQVDQIKYYGFVVGYIYSDPTSAYVSIREGIHVKKYKDLNASDPNFLKKLDNALELFATGV